MMKNTVIWQYCWLLSYNTFLRSRIFSDKIKLSFLIVPNIFSLHYILFDYGHKCIKEGIIWVFRPLKKKIIFDFFWTKVYYMLIYFVKYSYFCSFKSVIIKKVIEYRKSNQNEYCQMCKNGKNVNQMADILIFIKPLQALYALFGIRILITLHY